MSDSRYFSSAWPPAWGAPLLEAGFKTRPEDFQVEEILGYEPDGQGEHAWLQIEKRGLSTPQALRLLARAYGLPERDISCAGLKDKAAISRQWVSLRVGMKRVLPLPEPGIEGLKVLRQARHSRKLRRGAHRGNGFRVRLRNASLPSAALQERVAAIREGGVPNYFGPQRFGREGGNVEQALAWFAGARAPRDRFLRGMLLSAARSWLFNRVLAWRVERGDWNRYLPGDVMALDASASSFYPEQWDDVLARRLGELDIHPSGPLWGRGEAASRGQARALEEGLAREYPELCRGLEERGLEQERRSLRLKVNDLRVFDETSGEDLDEGRGEGSGAACSSASLVVEFSLASGGYATSVLKEVLSTL